MSIWDKLVEKCLLLLYAAFWPLTLVFVAGFPIRQGIVLGLLLAWLALGIGKAALKPVRRFTPYWVRVSPNYAGEWVFPSAAKSGHIEIPL